MKETTDELQRPQISNNWYETRMYMIAKDTERHLRAIKWVLVWVFVITPAFAAVVFVVLFLVRRGVFE